MSTMCKLVENVPTTIARVSYLGFFSLFLFAFTLAAVERRLLTPIRSSVSAVVSLHIECVFDYVLTKIRSDDANRCSEPNMPIFINSGTLEWFTLHWAQLLLTDTLRLIWFRFSCCGDWRNSHFFAMYHHISMYGVRERPRGKRWRDGGVSHVVLIKVTNLWTTINAKFSSKHRTENDACNDG